MGEPAGGQDVLAGDACLLRVDPPLLADEDDGITRPDEAAASRASASPLRAVDPVHKADDRVGIVHVIKITQQQTSAHVERMLVLPDGRALSARGKESR